MTKSLFISALLASCCLYTFTTGAPFVPASPHTPLEIYRRQFDTVSSNPTVSGDISSTSTHSICGTGKKPAQVDPSSRSFANIAKCANLGIPALDPSLIVKVKANLGLNSNQSWVSGTRMEALLEFDTPTMAVYHPGYCSNVRGGKIANSEVNAIAKSWLDRLPETANAMILDDGAIGDVAAVGVGFINAARTAQSLPNRSRFMTFASHNVNYLLRNSRRHTNGAISHRPPGEPFQAWNDNVYMVPPFLAYWGSMNNNFTVVQEAYRQIKAYREILRDPSTGFWMHVSNNGQWDDEKFWGSGMAWVTAGISRVFATYKHGPFASRLTTEMNDLAGWANELVAAAFSQQNAYSGLLPNTYNKADSTWDDTASSALFASAVYRLASLNVLDNEASMLTRAARIRQGIRGALNKETGWMWASDPLKWYVKTDRSPESMAFVLLMEAAARDYRLQNGC